MTLFSLEGNSKAKNGHLSATGTLTVHTYFGDVIAALCVHTAFTLQYYYYSRVVKAVVVVFVVVSN